ncbi:MAG: DUF2508 family protein [Lachnospiraceae bacterium]
MKVMFRQDPITDATEDIVNDTRENILEDIKKTRHALEIAYSGFDNVIEPDLIDSYIYEVNSILKRYKFLLSKIQGDTAPSIDYDTVLTPILNTIEVEHA